MVYLLSSALCRFIIWNLVNILLGQQRHADGGGESHRYRDDAGIVKREYRPMTHEGRAEEDQQYRQAQANDDAGDDAFVRGPLPEERADQGRDVGRGSYRERQPYQEGNVLVFHEDAQEYRDYSDHYCRDF